LTGVRGPADPWGEDFVGLPRLRCRLSRAPGRWCPFLPPTTATKPSRLER